MQQSGLVIDNRPTEPHEHICTCMKCGGRRWTCTAPRCYQTPGWPRCEVCDPTPPMRQTGTPLLRYEGYAPTGEHLGVIQRRL
jgi:hypothetical protein